MSLTVICRGTSAQAVVGTALQIPTKPWWNLAKFRIREFWIDDRAIAPIATMRHANRESNVDSICLRSGGGGADLRRLIRV
jgi:hypothetical protein